MKRSRARAGLAGSKPVEVISNSRRTDSVANPALLDKFIAGLANGRIEYAHPKFALNKVKEGESQKMCVYEIKGPETVVSWWSKDFANLIDRWDNNPLASAALNAYHHHFSFAINGPERSVLEPGLASNLAFRVESQLRWLVDKCRSLGQDPDHSILVKVDPISVYHAKEGVRCETTAHIPYLFQWLKAYGLSRVHISFTQFSWPAVRSRCKKLKAAGLEIVDLSLEAQAEILRTKVMPFAVENGITVQTCTALGHSKLGVVQGACVGFSDIHSITGGVADRNFAQPAKGTKYTSHCTCFVHRDVGDKTEPCTHGCRYCFSHPEIYDF